MRLLVVVIMAFLAVATCAEAQSGGRSEHRRRLDSMMQLDGIYRLDTNRLMITVDGRERPVHAVAYVTHGQLFISGHWRQDSTAKAGTEGVISACLIRVPGLAGEHRVVVDTMKREAHGEFSRNTDTSRATLFSAMYSAPKDGKAFTIYRSDWNGGDGAVTISSLADGTIRGTFLVKAYNADKPSDTKEMRGTFELPYRPWMDEYWAAGR